MPILVYYTVGLCNCNICNIHNIPPITMTSLVCIPVGTSPPTKLVAALSIFAPTEAESDELDPADEVEVEETGPDEESSSGKRKRGGKPAEKKTIENQHRQSYKKND